RNPDAPLEREYVHWTHDASSAAERAELGVERAQLDIRKHAARPQPAAPDLFVPQLGREGFGYPLPPRGAEKNMSPSFARNSRPAHGVPLAGSSFRAERFRFAETRSSKGSIA